MTVPNGALYDRLKKRWTGSTYQCNLLCSAI